MPYVDSIKQKEYQKNWSAKKYETRIKEPLWKKRVVTWEDLNNPEVAKAKSWKSLIEVAREHLGGTRRNMNRYVISQAAIKACTIRHGGDFRTDRFKKGLYGKTIKQFAEEIGVDRKTLGDWVRVQFLVINHLPEGSNFVNYTVAKMAMDMGRKDTPFDIIKRYLELLPDDSQCRIFVRVEKYLKTAIFSLDKKSLTALQKVKIRALLKQIETALS